MEVYRLGGPGAPEPYAFPEIPNLVVSRSGRVFARFRRAGTIAVFDGNGEYLRTIGGKGEGPGEFDFVFAHGLLGDTLWARNGFTPRISMFTEDGVHLSTVPTLVQLGDYRFSAPLSISGYMRQGRAYLLVDANVVGIDERIPLPLILGDRTLADRDTLLVLLNPPGVYVPRMGTFGPHPVAPPPLIDFAADGSGVTVVDWSDGAPARVRVRRFDPNGSLEWTRTVSFPPRRLARHLRDSLVSVYEARITRVADQVRQMGGYAPRDVRGAAASALALPEQLPAVRSVITGVDGTVWLEHRDGVTGGDWTVLDENGVPLFEVKLGPALTLQQASRRGIWATTVDALDVAYIVHLRLEAG